MSEEITDEQVEQAKQDLARRQARKQEAQNKQGGDRVVSTAKVREMDEKQQREKQQEINPLDITILMLQRNTRINNIVGEISALARDYGQSLEEVVSDVDTVLEAVKPKTEEEDAQGE